MNLDETAELLRYVCGVELRHAPDGAVMAWQDQLADIELSEAMRAARELYRQDAYSTPKLGPNVIRGRVKYIRDAEARTSNRALPHTTRPALSADEGEDPPF